MIHYKYISIVCALIGMGVLLVGDISYSHRLSISSQLVSLNQLLFLFAIVIYIILIKKYGLDLDILLYLMPLLIGFIPLIWSYDVTYGLYKIGNLTLCCVITISLFNLTIKITSKKILFELILFTLIFYLIIVLIYKYRYGFLNREENFFLNGAIVFGRLMGIASLLCLIIFKGLKGFVLYLILFAAVVWTGSKGPIISLVLCTFLYILIADLSKSNKSIVNIFKVMFKLSIIIVSIYYVSVNSGDFKKIGLSRLEVFFNKEEILNTSFGSMEIGQRSASVRIHAINESLDFIYENPFLGIGLGSWGFRSDTFLIYPHNIFLECLSECGIIFGSILLIPFVAFIGVLLKSKYAIIPLYLLICQQFSGDILDGRYIIVSSIIVLTNQNNKYKCLNNFKESYSLK